ncbi:MAG: hypothetical protein JXD19_11675 [Deltaproteobacteria bacterium]|nr:hypothetical protein [Deltaproteobacteria bacterium]
MAKTLGDITSELTEKVLSPAKAEAEKIVSQAKAEAERIVADATNEVAQIKQAAEKVAEETREQMRVDLETAARNFIIKVQEQLEKTIVEPTIEEEVKSTLRDRDFLKKIIEILLSAFSKSGGEEHKIEVLLPEQKKAELESWFLDKFRSKAEAPLTIQFTDKVSFGFKIGVEGSGQHFNFGDGFVEVISEFCSPRFRKHFFATKEE